MDWSFFTSLGLSLVAFAFALKTRKDSKAILLRVQTLDQQLCWRIGNDCRVDGCSREAALHIFEHVYSHPTAPQRSYFEQGFAGS